VDSYPGLVALPRWMQWWRLRGERLYKRACQVYRPIQQEMIKRIENGTATNCFGKTVNENMTELGFDEEQAMFIGMTLPLLELIGNRLDTLGSWIGLDPGNVKWFSRWGFGPSGLDKTRTSRT